MILINLLPPEFRQKKRTPFKMMAAVALSVAVNASLLAYWAWTAFGVAAEVSSELSVLEDTMGGLDPQIEYHDTLVAESKLFQSREKTLTDITTNRVSWTEKLDQMIGLIHRGGQGEQKYLVWLDGIQVDTEVNDRKKTYGTLTATGSSGSGNFAEVANFLDDVKASDLAEDFTAIADPEGPSKLTDEDLVPSEVWMFPFELALRSPEERAKSAAAEAAAEAATEEEASPEEPAEVPDSGASDEEEAE